MTRDAATQKQVDAADPHVSTWLSANAGSGKTRVLTDRVARLLLNGVSPQNILCLTYTKAAASEMQNRLFKRLGHWSMLKDGPLQDELETLGVVPKPDADGLARARTLFAQALETPGGLKIQTIHSFCASLLRQFPLEAGVSPYFTEIEERAAIILREDIVEDIAEGEHSPVMAGLAQHYTGDDLGKLTGEIAKHRDVLAQSVSRAEVWAQFGLADGFDEAALLANTFLPSDAQLAGDLVPLLDGGKVTDEKTANILASVDLNRPGLAEFDILARYFLTGKDAKSPYTAKLNAIPTKPIRNAAPDEFAKLDELMLRLEANRPIRNQLAAAERTFALREFAAVFLHEYAERKQARGWLDFDDLILLTQKLLTNPVVAEWVLFRLDGGIDHILVDEAQDTSPRQWRVIKALAQEFTTGEGARSNRNRTVFVVGDQKQSIYSFQGADPKEFDRMRDHFHDRLQDVGQPLNQHSLDHSFRSAPAILGLVDQILATIQGQGFQYAAEHIAFNADLPGRVDLWPVVEKPEAPEDKNWYDPTDMVAANAHPVILAGQIAERISAMIANGSLPDDSGGFRTIHAGDFLILVQRRSNLFHEIIRACKKLNLPIAGADRLKLGGELAVKDITALLAFLAMPDDDLSLAAALRSPLFGWSENDLFDLAQGRTEKRLWAELDRRREDFSSTHHTINWLLDRSDFFSPYELIEKILTRFGGRDNLLARLGPEAEDGIDALISQALSYEQLSTPSLTGFISWLEGEQVEVKRQAESAGDQIRVMTTHGAKGLESPIVILPDTAFRPVPVRGDIIETDDGFIWKSNAGAHTDVLIAALEDAKAAEEQERLRLLYVALTRAEKWLIVCASGNVGKPGCSWYNLVAEAMELSGAEQITADGFTFLRLQNGDWQPAAAVDADDTAAKATLPGWATTRAPVIDKAAKTISPSALPGPKTLPGDLDGDAQAIERGSLIHLLLEILPSQPHQDWETVGRALVDTAGTLPQGQRAGVLAEAIAVLQNPDLQHVFAPDTLAEVDISAHLPELDGQCLHGTIDRLIVADDRVLCVDFKSNAVVPDTPAETPLGLARQMAAYVSALSQIYPNRRVEAAILWTKPATLMVLPHDIVSNSLSATATS